MASFPERPFGVSRPALAVFVSGVASMGLEIVAGRVVAPEYGSSIYTWGSVIAVFLAALSLGYHRGGARAARATTDRLALLLLATAAYVAAVVLFADLLLTAASVLPLPGRFASLPAVALLFGPPTYLLGFVSPYAAELSASDDVGRASGRVYAVGTAGSILGAFGTTFVLVPALDISELGFVFGVVLVATALLVAQPSLRPASLAAPAAVSLLLLASLGGGSPAVPFDGVVYRTQTPYQELVVADAGDVRTLYLDGQRHSAMDLDDPTRHVFTYTRYFYLPYLFADGPDGIDRVLFVGGGGFTGPKRFLAEYDATVDVVELDPAVVRAARHYFRVPDSDRLNVHVGDGRRFLRGTNRTYDLIVLDAYQKDKVPFQLTTVEFMRLAADRLSPDGVLFANVISAPSGPAGGFYRAEHRTVERVFPQVYTFPTVGGPVVQNVELVATKSETPVGSALLRARNRERRIGVDLGAEIATYRRVETGDDVPVLRDARAPVDALLDPMVGRRYVVQRTPDPDATNATSTAAAGTADADDASTAATAMSSGHILRAPEADAYRVPLAARVGGSG